MNQNGDGAEPKRKRGRPRKVVPIEESEQPTPTRRKQAELPGVEGPGVSRPSIPELEELADVYADKRDRRMAATMKEVEAKDALSNAMHRHEDKLLQPDGTLRYEYDGGEKARRVVVLKPAKGEELKVKDVEAFDEVTV